MKDRFSILLKNTSIFRSVDDASLEFIISSARIIKAAPGDYFFRQNDIGRQMYIMEKGHGRVQKSWAGQELQLGRLGPGDCFGEMALIDPAPRSAAVQADTYCEAMEISDQAIAKLKETNVSQYVVVIENISRELCKRLRISDRNQMMKVLSTDRAANTASDTTSPGAFRPAGASQPPAATPSGSGISVDIELPWPPVY